MCKFSLPKDQAMKRLTRLLICLSALRFGICLKRGKCDADVDFNADVDVDAVDGDDRKSASLLESYRVLSPFKCIGKCCEHATCTSLTYRFSTESSENNCYLYMCREYNCPTKKSEKRIVYKLKPRPDVAVSLSTAVITISQAQLATIRDEGTTEQSTAETKQTITTETNSTPTPTLPHSVSTTKPIHPPSTYSGTSASATLGQRTSNFTLRSQETEKRGSIFENNYGILVTFAAFGIMILFATAYVVSNRVYESMKSYRYQNYRQIHYLINDRRWYA